MLNKMEQFERFADKFNHFMKKIFRRYDEILTRDKKNQKVGVVGKFSEIFPTANYDMLRLAQREWWAVVPDIVGFHELLLCTIKFGKEYACQNNKRLQIANNKIIWIGRKTKIRHWEIGPFWLVSSIYDMAANASKIYHWQSYGEGWF